jgi:hypothetical protein
VERRIDTKHIDLLDILQHGTGIVAMKLSTGLKDDESFSHEYCIDKALRKLFHIVLFANCIYRHRQFTQLTNWHYKSFTKRCEG